MKQKIRIKRWVHSNQKGTVWQVEILPWSIGRDFNEIREQKNRESQIRNSSSAERRGFTRTIKTKKKKKKKDPRKSAVHPRRRS